MLNNLSLRGAKRRSNPFQILSYGFILNGFTVNGLLPPTSIGVAMTGTFYFIVVYHDLIRSY